MKTFRAGQAITAIFDLYRFSNIKKRDDANSGERMIAVELKSIDRPQALAVTVENRGGVASPTLSTLCLKADI